MITYRVNGPVLHIQFPRSTGSSWSASQTQFLQDQQNPDVYDNPDRCRDVLRASSRYEGENRFVGFNIPAHMFRKEDTTIYPILKRNPSIRYVIAYMKGDTSTIEHELRHAKYYIDTAYRKRVRRSWNKIKRSNPKLHASMIKTFTNDGYQEKVWVDEFQAYYPERVD